MATKKGYIDGKIVEIEDNKKGYVEGHIVEGPEVAAEPPTDDSVPWMSMM
jgi:hypothetical protein